MAVITELPLEIIDTIISYLPTLEDLIQCSLVCRVLYWRAHNDLLWRGYLENIYAITEYPPNALGLEVDCHSIVQQYLGYQARVRTAFRELYDSDQYMYKIKTLGSLVDIPQFALYSIYHELYASGLYSSLSLASWDLLPRGPRFNYTLARRTDHNVHAERLIDDADRASYMAISGWTENLEAAYWTRQYLKFWKHRVSLRFFQRIALEDDHHPEEGPRAKFEDIVHSFHCFDGEYRHCVNENNMVLSVDLLPAQLLSIKRVTSRRLQAQLIVRTMSKVYGIPSEREMTDPSRFHDIRNHFIFQMGGASNHGYQNDDTGCRGLPMTRLAVFCALATHYGLHAKPIMFPLNVMGRVSDPTNPLGSFFVDVYRHCRVFEWGDLMCMLTQWRITPLAVHFAPASNRQILQRCLNNLDLSVSRAGGGLNDITSTNHEFLFLREICHHLKLTSGQNRAHTFNLGFVETKLWQHINPDLVTRVATDWDMGLMKWLESNDVAEGENQHPQINGYGPIFYAGQLVESPRLATFGVVIRRFRVYHEYVYTVLSQEGPLYNIGASELGPQSRTLYTKLSQIAQFCRLTEVGFFFKRYDAEQQMFVPGKMLARRIPLDMDWHKQRGH